MRTTGETYRRLMRQHKITIRQLAAKMQVTMKQVRKARDHGMPMPGAIDYEEAIVGEYTPRLQAMLRQWQNERISSF